MLSQGSACRGTRPARVFGEGVRSAVIRLASHGCRPIEMLDSGPQAALLNLRPANAQTLGRPLVLLLRTQGAKAVNPSCARTETMHLLNPPVELCVGCEKRDLLLFWSHVAK